MALSPILASTLMTQSQANKDVTVNDHLKAVEKGRGYLSKSVAGGAGTTSLTPDEARYGVLELTGALTGNRIVDVPAGFDHSIIVLNSTTGAFSVTFRYNGGTAYTIPKGSAIPLRKSSGGAAVPDVRGSANLGLPYFLANHSTTQSINGATDTKIAFDTEEADPSGSFDNATNYRFTAPVTGLYRFTARVAISSIGTLLAAPFYVWLAVNGSVSRKGTREARPTNTTGHVVDALIQLTAGDYVEFYARSDSASGTGTLGGGATEVYFQGVCERLG